VRVRTIQTANGSTIPFDASRELNLTFTKPDSRRPRTALLCCRYLYHLDASLEVVSYTSSRRRHRCAATATIRPAGTILEEKTINECQSRRITGTTGHFTIFLPGIQCALAALLRRVARGITRRCVAVNGNCHVHQHFCDGASVVLPSAATDNSCQTFRGQVLLSSSLRSTASRSCVIRSQERNKCFHGLLTSIGRTTS